MSSKVTGPLFKWFGSKWLSSRTLPVPLFDTVVEPFAGGAGYSLRHAERKVVLLERDEHVFALWTWLIEEATEDLVRSIPVGLPVGTDLRTIGLTSGQALLCKSWQRTNNVGSCWTVSPWGNKPGQWTESTRSRVAEQLHAVKHWTVAGNDALRFMVAPRAEKATWFIDPPYQYNYGYRQPPVNYAALAEAVRGLAGQAIVCEAVCPKTQAVPAWLPFKPFAERVTSRRKSTENHHSKELLWTSETS